MPSDSYFSDGLSWHRPGAAMHPMDGIAGRVKAGATATRWTGPVARGWAWSPGYKISYDKFLVRYVIIS